MSCSFLNITDDENVKQFINGYVGNRVLRMNVGFLLADGPGHTHDTEFDVPAVRIADDADADYVRGKLRLSRTKEGILVQGVLRVGLSDECYRCLRPVQRDIAVEVEELFASPPMPDSEFSIGDDAILDLAPLLRAETLIADSRGELCQEDCKGLCAECGANLNIEACSCEEAIDPRMAALRQLLDKG